MDCLRAVPTKSVDIFQIGFYAKHHTGDKEVGGSFKWFICSKNLRWCLSETINLPTIICEGHKEIC